MATLLEFRDYVTNDVEPLFKALYCLQRTPGCEEEADSIAKKLRDEFMKMPETSSKGTVCRIANGRYKYFENGIVELAADNGLFVVIDPWTAETEAVEEKPKKRNPSFAYIKTVNKIWYAQLMRHRKRSFSVRNDEKIYYQNTLDKYEIFKELSEEEQKMVDVDKIIGSLEDEAQDLHRLFHIRYDNLTGLTYDHYRRERSDIKTPESFFFLTEAECEALCSALEKDNLSTRSWYSFYDLQHTVETVRDILRKPSKNRQWIIRPNEDHIYYQETVDNGHYTYNMTKIRHEEVWDHYKHEFEDLNDEHLYLLKRFSIVIEKEKGDDD